MEGVKNLGSFNVEGGLEPCVNVEELRTLGQCGGSLKPWVSVEGGLKPLLHAK